MKPFRLSRFMTGQPGLERQFPRKATPNDGTCAADLETKPVCLRCQKTNIQCEGYSNTGRQKDSWYQDSGNAMSRPPSKSAALHPAIYSGPTLLSEQDGRYFRYYCETSVAEIARLFNRPFWDWQIPQVSENEAFVSQALVALGAISKAQTVSAAEAYQHRQYALRSYAKALSWMRQSLNGSSYSPRKALVACLLVYTIEAMLGHFATAATHASCGEKLLYRNFFNPENKSYSPFRCQQDASIDDDLCRAFSDLSLQVIGVIDTQGLDLHRERIDDLTHALRFMPSKFSNLQEAYDWWQLILRRNVHWISLARRTMLGKHQESGIGVAVDNEELDLKNVNCSWLGAAVIPASSPELRQECATFCDDIMRWESVASPLLVQGMEAPTESREFFASCLLKLQSLGMLVQIPSVFAIDEIEWDQFYPQFEMIMHYASKIRTQLFQGQGKYHLDFGVVLFVAIVGFHCRKRALRDQAIDMLSTNHGYREGMWDAVGASMVARFGRDMEEEWADEDGWVPAERRFTITGAKAVLGEDRSMYVCGYQKNGTMDGKGIFKEMFYRW
ncbi:hypothetical protein CJF30_00004191 [Rutstroemia sp. NJR-2017a BBW]|nr:hypothetical protein CJF30_00004191 [Rutstroemia sp. NJR-2017a BBW]